MHSLLDSLAKACAIVGGLVMAAITLMTTGSVIGRYVFSKPLLGDTEAVQFGMALAVAAFLPMCQWKSGNIIVDFFTTKAKDSTKRVMDAFGAVLIAVMVGVIGIRTISGVLSQKSAGSTTMLLQWPEWIAYACMVPPLLLTAVIALYMAFTGRDGRPADSDMTSPAA